MVAASLEKEKQHVGQRLNQLLAEEKMRVASTGLGQTELVAGVKSMSPKGDDMGLYALATSPAEWHLETYLEPQDVWPVVFGFLRPSILWVIVLAFLFPWRKGSEPQKL